MPMRTINFWAMVKTAAKLLFFSMLLTQATAISTVGREVVLVFLANEVDFPRNIAPTVHIANSKYNGQANVTITVIGSQPGCEASRTVSILGGSAVRVPLCIAVRWSIVDPEFAAGTKIVYITATQPVSVWGMNEETQSAGAFLGFSTAVLGTNYYVVTYDASVGNAEFGIVSLSNGTLLTVTLPDAADSSVPLETTFRCLRYAAGSSFSFTMQANQVYRARSTRDLTGTRILANKPVAVFAGNARASVAGERGKDHVVEQMISTGSLDSQFVVVPTSSVRASGSPDVVRIVASVDNITTVWLTTNVSSMSFVLTSGGMFVDQTLTGVTYINASNPVLVTLFTADQAMLIVPGMQHYVSEYYAPIYYNTYAGANYQSTYAAIITRNDTLYNLRINNDIGSLQVPWQPVPGRSGLLAALSPLPTTSAVISIENLTPTSKFGAYHYGAGNLQAFASALTLDLPKRCEPSLAVIGDGIDNDCNGKADDQQCTSTNPNADCGYAQLTSYGKEFVFVFETNQVDDSLNAVPSLSISITPMSIVSLTRVSLSSPLYSNSFSLSQNVSVQPGRFVQINIPSYYIPPADTSAVATGAYTIRVLASQDVALAALNRITGSTDSLLVFPVESLGYDYYTVTYYPGDDSCQFSVVAVEPGTTQLLITMPNPDTAIVVQMASGTCTNGQVCATQLAQYQSMQVQSTSDLTGARVQSVNGKKIAVYSGNIRARVVSTTSRSRDHLIDAMPPVPTWGRLFVVVGSPRTDTIDDYVRVVASRPNTRIFVDLNDTGPAAEYVIANAGGFVQIVSPSQRSIRISSVNPILVAQITQSSRATGDPSLIVVPAVQQWQTAYRFSVFSSTVLGSSYVNYVLVAISTTSIAGLQLNGNPLSVVYPALNWTAIPNTPYSTTYFAVNSNLTSYSITHISASVTFLVLQYGVGDRESYGNPSGGGLIQQPCVPNVPFMVGGDAVDNDCDGTVDEETLNGYDDDFDGLIDEDCGPTVTVPADPAYPRYRYWIAFMQNDAEEYKGYPLEVHVASLARGNAVRLRLPVPLVTKRCDDTVALDADRTIKFDISPLYRLSGTSVSSYRAVIVETNQPSSVYAFNKETFTIGATSILREDGLGLSYYVVCSRPQDLYCQFAVVACSAQTVLTVVLPRCTSAPCTTVLVTFNGNNYVAGASFTVSLTAYQTLQILSSADLTGTSITSNKRVAVFSGNDRTSVGPLRSRDNMLEQLPPVTSWGTEYFLVSSPGRVSGDLFRVVASADGTTVSWYNRTLNLNAGGFMELPMDSGSALCVRSDKPIMIALITKSADITPAGKIGDPAMLMVPSTAHYVAHAVFSLPVAASDTAYTNYLVLVAPAWTPSDLTRLTLNDQALPASLSWQPVAGTESNQFWTASIALDARLVSGNSAVAIQDATGDKFYAFVAGNGDREGYAFNAGDYFTA